MSQRKNRSVKDRAAVESPVSSRAEAVESALPQAHPPRRRPWFLALTSIALGLWLLFLFFVALKANR
jgi:hypothetical protein